MISGSTNCGPFDPHLLNTMLSTWRYKSERRSIFKCLEKANVNTEAEQRLPWGGGAASTTTDSHKVTFGGDISALKVVVVMAA